MIAVSTKHIIAMLVALFVRTGQLRSQGKRTAELEAYLDTCGIVRLRGYRCREHPVATKDGYLLSMHRVSPKNRRETNKTREPIILQHGLLQSSADWVINYPNQSLGFILADAGYDVWLGNVRGNVYSKGHISLSRNMKEYWNFTFDQMAAYDLPAMVEYVLQYTKYPSLHYVGHSQGTLIGFACFSEEPDWALKKIRSFHAFAPVAFVGHTGTIITGLRPYYRQIKWLLETSGGEFLPEKEILQWIGRRFCRGKTALFCKVIILRMFGYNSRNINSTRLPIYVSHYLAGTSKLNIAHFGQLVMTNRMQKYDRGMKRNLELYNQTTPPDYQPERMRVPTALYWAADDILCVEEDVRRLVKKVQHQLGLYRYEYAEHMDFVWGLNMASGAYARLIEVLSALRIH